MKPETEAFLRELWRNTPAPEVPVPFASNVEYARWQDLMMRRTGKLWCWPLRDGFPYQPKG